MEMRQSAQKSEAFDLPRSLIAVIFVQVLC